MITSTYSLEKAIEVYDREPGPRSFSDDFALYLTHGYVISTPRCFVMGRPVDSKAPLETVLCPWIQHENPDCWWIGLMAGDITEAFRFLPGKLKKIGFEKNNKPRFYDLERFHNVATRVIQKWIDANTASPVCSTEDIGCRTVSAYEF